MNKEIIRINRDSYQNYVGPDIPPAAHSSGTRQDPADRAEQEQLQGLQHLRPQALSLPGRSLPAAPGRVHGRHPGLAFRQRLRQGAIPASFVIF